MGQRLTHSDVMSRLNAVDLKVKENVKPRKGNNSKRAKPRKKK